jgi:hypothetical protein
MHCTAYEIATIIVASGVTLALLIGAVTFAVAVFKGY